MFLVFCLKQYILIILAEFYGQRNVIDVKLITAFILFNVFV